MQADGQFALRDVHFLRDLPHLRSSRMHSRGDRDSAFRFAAGKNPAELRGSLLGAPPAGIENLNL